MAIIKAPMTFEEFVNAPADEQVVFLATVGKGDVIDFKDLTD